MSSPEELDDNMQTYEEFRIQVDRELGISSEGHPNDSSRKKEANNPTQAPNPNSNKPK